MKNITTAMLISTAMIVTGCGDDKPKQQQAQYPTQQYQQQPQPVDQYGNVQQPLAVQPPQMMNPQGQPIIINNTTPQGQVSHDNSGSSALLGMAAGAAMGAVAANMMHDDSPRERVIEKHYVSMPSNASSQYSNAPQQVTPIQPAVAPQAVATPTKTEKNAMDMTKLAASAKYAPPSQQQATQPSGSVPSVQPSKMNMGALSSSSQPIRKPSPIGSALISKPTSGKVNLSKR